MKKRLSLMLALIMTISSVSTVSAKEFSDIENNWAETQIYKWTDYNVLGGYTDGTFKPEGYITRAEMAAMMDKIMRYEVMAENAFEDLSGDEWYAESILKNLAAGNISSDRVSLDAKENITRQEVAVFIANALNMEPLEGETTFEDDSEISSWAKGYVNVLSQNGFISGRPGNIYAPMDNITRAEVVAILDNVIRVLYVEEGTYTDGVEGNAVVNTEDVVLKDMTIDGDLVVAAGVGEGDVTLDNVIVTGNIIVEGGGANSIKLTNNTSASSVRLQKSSKKKVRLFIDENSVVSRVETSSGSAVLLDGKGNFGDVTINGTSDVTISEDVTIGRLEVIDGKNIENNGTVEELVVDETVIEITIVGNGKITVVISNNGALNLYSTVGKLIIKNPNAQIKVSENVSRVEDNKGNSVKDKVSVEDKNKENSNNNSSNSSNNNSSSSDRDKTAPKIVNLRAKYLSNETIITFNSNESGLYDVELYEGDDLISDSSQYELTLRNGKNEVTLTNLSANVEYKMVLTATDKKGNARRITTTIMNENGEFNLFNPVLSCLGRNEIVATLRVSDNNATTGFDIYYYAVEKEISNTSGSSIITSGSSIQSEITSDFVVANGMKTTTNSETSNYGTFEIAVTPGKEYDVYVVL